jgi:hypothetical protein
MDPATDSLPEFTEALNEYKAGQVISWEQLKLGYDLEPADFSQTEETMSKAEEVEYETFIAESEEEVWEYSVIEDSVEPEPFLHLAQSFSGSSCINGWRVYKSPAIARLMARSTTRPITLYADGTWSYDAHPQRDGE